MTRIIGGSAGGRRIAAPRGGMTRPTSDRVREALFSAMEADFGSLDGLRFLDLYSGSGAIGLEAWSRGAGVVTLVEKDRRAAKLVRQNAKVLGFHRAEVRSTPVASVLAATPPTPYDIAFLDPPYALDDSQVAADLAALAGHGWLVPDALVVCERGSRSPEPWWPHGIRGERSRRYGETTLWYGRADPSAPDDLPEE